MVAPSNPSTSAAPDQRVKSVLCIGVAVYDQIFALDEIPQRPTKIFASNFAATVGGPAANAAITVSRQGGQATLWARIGADMQGDRIVADLASNGVDVSCVRRVEGARSGTSAVAVSNDGERMLLVFADPTLDADPSWLPLDEVARFDAVLADVRWPAAARLVMAKARELGKPVVLDADLTSDKTALSELIPLATHVLFSEPALEQVAGSDGSIRDRLGFVYAKGAHAVVGVTLGEKGCAWLDRSGYHEEPGVQIVAIDTLAAGDVFHGAYALATARALPEAESVRFANLVAAVKCTQWGGGSTIPTTDEVETFAREYNSRPQDI
ncbi:PfkB family carbohydrate kinase [Microvirga lotononidis]|nr:PfkB family carbohydrate kinase [Microvirga lotononidis]WQO32010.1 PfkB family carbohydrate kinase [Microvirga lotononidis]